MKNNTFDHKKIEEKWQERWEKEKVYKADIEKGENPFYNLWMFPYPSAEGLHAGHAFASTGSDIYGRFMRMRNHNVFQPIGYDSFGIHSENFAIKINQTPQEMLSRTTKNYERQLRSLGHGYDWTRTVTTSETSYYKWTQWLFIEMFKAGLAYKKEALVNFCSSCKTVLADEQTVQSEDDTESVRLCERCGTKVERKKLNQWFFRITNYAEKLLEGLDDIDWSQRVVAAQREWIGKKKGFTIDWEVEKESKKDKISTFTTRLDTIFGVTFLAVAPEHPIVESLFQEDKEVMKYVSDAISKSEQTRKAVKKEKSGIETKAFAVHPITKEKIPIWVADFILADYGTGAIMGVPAHDGRDFDFAKTNNIPIKQVVLCNDKELKDEINNINKDVAASELCYEGYGLTTNSDKYSNLSFKEAVNKISADYSKDIKEKETYHLRDWLISRQRYWGPPIPMIYCESCKKQNKSWFNENNPDVYKDQSDWDYAGWYPEENLPIELPFLENYHPKGDGSGPLAKEESFYNVKCPHCGSDAKRETDVSDTFLDSSWYFLRYPSVNSKTEETAPFDDTITKDWLPVNLYFGGAEHSVLHLIYSRFVTMVLYDRKHINFKEPFPKFFAHGLMIKDGSKMSKSKGNVINPDDYVEKFGADVMRLYLMFMGPMDGSPDFRDTGIEGMQKFVNRVWNIFKSKDDVYFKDEDINELQSKTHKTIKKVTEDINCFRYNTAISSLMELINLIQKKSNAKKSGEEKIKGEEKWQESLKALALMMAPFAPHLAEEAWVDVLSQDFSVHHQDWPSFDSKVIEAEDVSMIIQINGKTRGLIEVNKDISNKEEDIKKIASGDAKISRWLKGKKIKKIIFVPGKLINFLMD